MARKEIARFGTHGRGVRVFVETFAGGRQALVRAQWRENGLLKTESLPDSRQNQKTVRAYAEGVAERLRLQVATPAERMTMYQLGERYVLAHPVPETWRPKTLKSFRDRWRLWLTFAGADRAADTVTHDTMDELRGALRAQDYAINQVANIVQTVKSVYRFARARKYLAENPLADYEMKLSRDQRRLEVPEWTNDEAARILAALDPRNSRQWRPYVAIVLDAVLGGRSNALLHLEWRDVDFGERTLRWRPELDKLAKDRVQPLPRAAVRVLRLARVWRHRLGYVGPYVIPSATSAGRGVARELKAWQRDPRHKQVGLKTRRVVRDRPYSYGALHYQLQEAAARASVRWIPYRAMHGFRRLVLGNALALTGNLVRAGQFIGDVDMRTLTRSYVRERPEDLRDVARAMMLPETPAKREAVPT